MEENNNIDKNLIQKILKKDFMHGGKKKDTLLQMWIKIKSHLQL